MLIFTSTYKVKQHSALCAENKIKMETNDDFNRIVEMNTEAERRKFAAMAMQGIIANGELVDPDEVTDMALIYADELIAKLNKKKDEDK